MNIVIVGAGEVGRSIANTLAGEQHDVYLVEQDEDKAREADEALDVRVIRGNGARPQVLSEAGISEETGRDVDLLLACTDHDEVNMLSCWIAHRAGVKRVISRVRNLEFTDSPTWGKKLGIDIMISPERSLAREILELLAVTSASKTAELLDGRAAIYAFKASEDSPLVGKSLKDIRIENKSLAAVFVYVEREEGEDIVPDGDTVINAGDLCYVVTYKEAVWLLEKLFQLQTSRELRKVFIVGGGKVGFQTAMRIRSEYPHSEIRLIDSDAEKCAKLSKEFGGDVIVLNGDGADKNLLSEEGISDADGFVCATESDEVNLVYAAIAKSMGARKSIAVVRRRQYQEMTDLMPVDAVVDPNEALASVILSTIRYPGHTRALSVIEKINAEMVEIVLPRNHPLEGKPLFELKLPKGVLLALIGRRKSIFVPTGATTLEAGDRIILFASTELMPETVALFNNNTQAGTGA